MISRARVDLPAPGTPARIVIDPRGRPSFRFSSIGVLSFLISVISSSSRVRIWGSGIIFSSERKLAQVRHLSVNESCVSLQTLQMYKVLYLMSLM